jgi:hypothetical protein
VVVLIVLIVVVAAALGTVVFGRSRGVLAAGGPIVATGEATGTPFETVIARLRKQAAALLAGDEAGWLAPVDPALQPRYKTMYASLRGLDISQFSYNPHLVSDPSDPVMRIDPDVSYCFSMGLCPPYGTGGNEAPRLRQTITVKSVGGNYLITGVAPPQQKNRLNPPPWDNTALTLRQGARVTVAAVPGQAAHVAEVLAIAQRAATVEDRFAKYVENPQKRYRIYLADAKAWRTWYGGGIDDKWVVGYAMPLNADGTDVVLNMPALAADHELMATTIKHEMGHVITLSGANPGHEEDMWLSEGIAEYIGWAPQPATASWRRSGVHAAVHSGHRPATIALPPPGPDAGPTSRDAYYGLAHFAVDCLARKYGERALFDFVRYRLQNGFENDDSSRRAFGKQFGTVDKACVAWIRKTA